MVDSPSHLLLNPRDFEIPAFQCYVLVLYSHFGSCGLALKKRPQPGLAVTCSTLDLPGLLIQQIVIAEKVEQSGKYNP